MTTWRRSSRSSVRALPPVSPRRPCPPRRRPPGRGAGLVSPRAPHSTTPSTAESPDEIRDRAECGPPAQASRSFPVAGEARTALSGLDGVDDAVIEEVVAKFVDLGYLDDEAFAEQLAMSAIERRGQGRRAVAQTLRKRGSRARSRMRRSPSCPTTTPNERWSSPVEARNVGGKDYDPACVGSPGNSPGGLLVVGLPRGGAPGSGGSRYPARAVLCDRSRRPPYASPRTTDVPHRLRAPTRPCPSGDRRLEWHAS